MFWSLFMIGHCCFFFLLFVCGLPVDTFSEARHAMGHSVASWRWKMRAMVGTCPMLWVISPSLCQTNSVLLAKQCFLAAFLGCFKTRVELVHAGGLQWLWLVVISVACSIFPLQTRYVVCSVGATVWPSSTQYMVDCLTLLQNVCSLSPCNVGHVQTPVFHSATSMQAHMKHSRKVEDILWKANLDISQRVTLLFSKETTRQGSDKRALTQACISPFAGKNCKWQESEAHLSGVVGPLPLLKVSEMVGYDSDTGMRPGAASRVEQMLGQCLKLNLSKKF